MSGDSSRKPSGSSTHSGAHSPTSASGNAQPSRKLPSGPGANMFGVGGGNSLKALNTGWQVWGSAASPASKRNASMSSLATGGGEMLPPQPKLSEPWPASRSTSGAWDDSALKKDFSSVDSQSQLNLRNTRQRQSPLGFLHRGLHDTRNLNIGKDSNPSRYSSTKSLGPGPYQSQQPSRQHAQQSTMPMPVPAQVSNSQMRSQQRGTYNAYPTTDYGYYPPGPWTRILRRNLHPNPVDIRQQQPGVYFDYNAGGRPPSQFYFPPPQPMMYPPPHSPMLASQIPASSPVTLAEKKLEMQYNLQQQLASRNLMFRAAASPHPQAYNTLDYGSQMLNVASMYPPTPQSLAQNLRGNRRHDIQHELALPRSPMLDEFRASKGRKWELRDITGFVVEFSGDQHGSRFIQNELTTATSEERQSVFDEIVPDNTLQLIQDVFGNYVIQKLFEHGTQAQKTVLANTMDGHVMYLSSNLYGCRVVQKAIESILPDQQASFVRELEPYLLKCVKDSNGNHVIQKVIERVSPDRLGFVSSFIGHVHELASHPFGCRVLQRCLQHLPDSLTRPLLNEVLDNYTTNLMQDQFGNYVIQFILEHGKPEDKARSNVCEKALIFADSETRRLLIEELMTPSSKGDGATPIVTMMKDQFANYVLQRALAVAEGEQKQALINTVRPQLVSMRKQSTAYSKHLTSIERELEKLSPSISNN
ncbi:armadillo-type protein [Mycena rebaudengoi]|nr:armadillo-type protein [Mycena rebaudengoi]